MPLDAETNATLAAVCASENYEQVARDGLEHLAAFTPIRFEAPPSWLQSALDQARQHGREGNLQAAKNTVTSIATGGTLQEFGKYREHVTWVEAENARKLAALAWMWATLRAIARHDVAIDRKLEQLERFAHDPFDVRELRTERGWAEKQTRADALLPPAWRCA